MRLGDRRYIDFAFFVMLDESRTATAREKPEQKMHLLADTLDLVLHGVSMRQAVTRIRTSKACTTKARGGSSRKSLSISSVVRADFHCEEGRRKANRRSPASSRLAATAGQRKRHLRRNARQVPTRPMWSAR